MVAQYVRLSEGLKKYKLIPDNENVWDHIKSNELDHYVSIFKYNEEQYKHWQKTKSIAGIEDVTTSRIVLDFDDSKNPENARQDAITVVSRLLSKGIPENNIQVSFSGNKGFGLEVDTTSVFSNEEFKNVVSALAGDLPTFDKVVSDPARIVRVVGTKHPKSGLYKFPLSVRQLSELDVKTIKTLAASLDNIDEGVMEGWQQVVVPESIAALKKTVKEKKKKEVQAHSLDMKLKPKWLSEAKYALQEGYFGAGERNTAFMVLASTYKNQGFNKEITYRMLKGVAEVQAARNGVDRYADEELWNNIAEVIFNPAWKGGQYSYENTPLLQEITARMGLKIPQQDVETLVPIDNVTTIFKKFATDIDKNTIKLGIPVIDEQIRITTSMLVGLLAAPSAGKTSVSLNILNDISRSNQKALFFSMDMGAPLVFQRLIQKHTGLSSKKIFEMYKGNDPKLGEIERKVSDEYKNIRFCFKSGITTDHIKEYIIKQQELDGDKIRLVVLDYLECITGPYSDPTANTALIAQQLKDIANELDLCIILLLQPQKHAGDPSAELLSMRQVKGSSVVEQAASIIFTMWRPGFSAKTPENDKYLTLAIVKNRMGQLGAYDFGWEGLTGEIQELDDYEKEELNALRQRKAQEKAALEL